MGHLTLSRPFRDTLSLAMINLHTKFEVSIFPQYEDMNTQTQPFQALWVLSGTTRVSRYQKKHSPTHTHRGQQSSLSASSIYYNS